jgi:hypothetical protein
VGHEGLVSLRMGQVMLLGRDILSKLYVRQGQTAKTTSEITAEGLFLRRKMPPQRLFMGRLRRTPQIPLDPACSMNRLSGELFLVLSHNWNTRIGRSHQ